MENVPSARVEIVRVSRPKRPLPCAMRRCVFLADCPFEVVTNPATTLRRARMSVMLAWAATAEFTSTARASRALLEPG